MFENDGVLPKLMCKYYPKALCLRDNHNGCESCPYFRLYKKENKSSHKASKDSNDPIG